MCEPRLIYKATALMRNLCGQSKIAGLDGMVGDGGRVVFMDKDTPFNCQCHAPPDSTSTGAI